MLVKPGIKVSLKDYDPDDTSPYGSSKEAEADLQKQLDALVKLQNLLYACSHKALLIILQGIDTCGTDGTMRHVMSGLSPRGVQAKSFKVPTAEELATE